MSQLAWAPGETVANCHARADDWREHLRGVEPRGGSRFAMGRWSSKWRASAWHEVCNGSAHGLVSVPNASHDRGRLDRISHLSRSFDLNLLIAGTRAFEDWVAHLITVTRSQFAVPPLRLHLQVTSDRALADVIVMESPSVTSGDDAPESARQLPRLLVVNPDDEPPATASLDTLYLFRGDAERQQFGQLMSVLWQRAHFANLAKMLGGPVDHDVRGVQSVLHLSRQLIDAGADARPISPKLSKAGRKLNNIVSQLKNRATCAMLPSTLEGQVVAVKGPNESVLDWFQEAHPDRALGGWDAVERFVTHSPKWAEVALVGVIDGCARLTGDALTASIDPNAESTGAAITIHGKAAQLSDAQKVALSQAARLCLVDPELLPFRLLTAAALIGTEGGQLSVQVNDFELSFTIHLPPNQAEPSAHGSASEGH